MSRELHVRLHRALEQARRGAWMAVGVEVERARQEGLSSSTSALLVAAHVLFVARRYHDSGVLLDQAAARPDGLVALWHKYQDTLRLGWEHEALAALEQGASRDPGSLRWRAASLTLLSRRRERKAALRQGAGLLALRPHDVSLLIELAALHGDEGESAQAREKLARAMAGAADPLARLETARLLRNLGDFDEATRLLRSLSPLEAPVGPQATRMLAELALWRGDTEAATTTALPLGPAGERILGACAMLRGDHEQAARHLHEALRHDASDSEAHAWQAQRLTDAGAFEQAHEHLSRSIASARDPSFVVHLLRLRLNLREPHSHDRPKLAHAHHLKPALLPLLDDPARLHDDDPAVWAQLIEETLLRMRGNRSTTPTWVIDGQLRLLTSQPDPRFEARRVLERFRVAPPEPLIAELHGLADRFPLSGLPHAHLGELFLWMGRPREARAALENALSIDLRTRWAHIGLTMCDLLEGHPARALETSARGVSIMQSEGPAVFVHRAEALRELGRLDEARADLAVALRMHPSRVGAWLNQGLLELARNQISAVRAIVERLDSLAPGLLSDAARLERVLLFPAAGQIEDQHLEAVLRRALSLAQGNRSSSGSSHLTPEGLLRFSPYGGQQREGIHHQDAARLDLAERLLPSSPVPPTRTSPPRALARTTLTPQQVASFLERGYVRLPGAFPRELAARWVEQAHERVHRDPAQFIKNHVALQGQPLRLDDPTTWQWPRVDVLPSQQISLELLPQLRGAVDDLLGGGERVETRTLHDYFILNFPLRARPPVGHGWHVDDPSRAMKLGTLRHGLVGFVLFSNVAPEGGATRLLEGSVTPVARLLASHPQGIDLVDAPLVSSLTHLPTHLVSGEVGDVVLAHALLVHASGPNEGQSIRWLGNPMFYLRQPLDPGRADRSLRSPVEEAIALALS